MGKPRNKGMRRAYLQRYSGSQIGGGFTPNKEVIKQLQESARGLEQGTFKDTPAFYVRGVLRHHWIDEVHSVEIFSHPRRTVVLSCIRREYYFRLQDKFTGTEKHSLRYTSKLVAMQQYHNDAIQWGDQCFPLEPVMRDS